MSDTLTMLAPPTAPSTPPPAPKTTKADVGSSDRAKGDAGRVASLDGVRGVAALVVVLTHALVAAVPLMAAQFSGGPPARTGTSAWWLTATPLRFFWAGPEAVILFFILSGFVLAIPAVRYGARWFDASFYPRRVLRLYIPLWGGLVVAVLIHAAVRRTEVPGATFWLNAHAVPMHLLDFFRSAALLHEHNSFEFTSVLWTLRWELIFSMLLPLVLLYPLMTRKMPALSAAGALACLGLIYFGAYRDNYYLLYLPMFVFGSIMAFHAPRLQAIAARSRPKALGWFLAITVGLLAIALLTCAYWSVVPPISILRLGSHTAFALIKTASTVGAALIICLSLVLPTWGRALGKGPLAWLGSRSYSLYLVHEPILVTVALLLGGKPAVAPYLFIAVGGSLIAAELFHRAVGDPAIGIARRAGRACNRAFQNVMGTSQGGAARKDAQRPASPRLRPTITPRPRAAVPALAGAHAGGGLSNGFAGGGTNGFSSGSYAAASNGVRHGASNGVRHGIANGSSHAAANGFGNGSHAPANGSSHAANGSSHAAANGVRHGSINGISNGSHGGTTNGSHGAAANGVTPPAGNGFHNGAIDAHRAQSSMNPFQRQRETAPVRQRVGQLPLAAVLPPPVHRVSQPPLAAPPPPPVHRVAPPPAAATPAAKPPAFTWTAPPAQRRHSPPATALDHAPLPRRRLPAGATQEATPPPVKVASPRRTMELR